MADEVEAPPPDETGAMKDVFGSDDEEETPEESEGETPEETDDEDEEETSEETPEEEESEEDDEDDEEVDEDKDKDDKEEETDEDLSLLSRPSIKEIKAKYPNLFKDFPDLRHMYFREQQYNQLFPTIDDAKVAAQRNEILGGFEDAIFERGNSAELLNALAENNKLEPFLDNFLPTLLKGSPEDYIRITTPVLKQVLRSMKKEAESAGNKNLTNSIWHISNHLFDSDGEIPADAKKETPKVDPEKLALQERLDNIARSTEQDFARATLLRGKDKLEEIIAKNIDPKGVLTDFTKKAVIKETYETVMNKLKEDPKHRQLMGQLWKAAKKGNFTGEHRASLVNAFLARARTLVPEIRAKLRSEALGKKSVKTETTATKKKTHVPAGGSGGKVSGKVDTRKIDWRNTSDKDIFSDRVTLRK